ncbi:PstS family phosphate ABC transporter substrate-binding protein [Mycoplasma sp. Mirounga ES2805-ORL]|uniref:PstS family phosphate ABC transporter substrate-binding protein n=1 Tax=Mycoplasma sp. Mirounga ES2805-ORL TaxID=754514 RepID=UPI00197C4C6B|nr:substrate-binding domain-containing protein [Mycoplasma sp. Mirounga ES2805-ORL]QSF13461.1 PstS family phosphate ABC transporter substrate-binding protein [Mycoplasma sp. Mirounga ES2805-ORL]
MNKKIFFLFSSVLAIPFTTTSCGFLHNSIQAPNLDKYKINKTIIAEGSSSVLPILKDVENISKGKLQYTSTGSGSGIKSINKEKGKSNNNIAITSSTKTPVWLNKDLRTITWAIDAIAIIVHLPHNLKTKDQKAPLMDMQSLIKLYKGQVVTWSELIFNLDKKSNSKVIALGRLGGKKNSGTAHGFMHTLLKYDKSILSESEKQDIENHIVLPEENKISKEPNSSAFQVVEDKEGSLTYVSLDFALKNKNSLVKIANIRVDSSTIWIPTIENVINGNYSWTRPFNAIFDTKDEEAKLFIEYILSADFQKYIEKKGFIPLNTEQLLLQNNLNKSDEELFNAIKNDSLKLNKYVSKHNCVYGLNL